MKLGLLLFPAFTGSPGVLAGSYSISYRMAPLGWSGGSQFSSMILPVGSAVMVSMRGGEGAACGRGRKFNCDEMT